MNRLFCHLIPQFAVLDRHGSGVIDRVRTGGPENALKPFGALSKKG